MERDARSGPAGDGRSLARAGFKAYWAMLCKARKRGGGGRRISKAIHELIFQMVAENPSWGAPRIHGELLMLGLEVSEITVSRWMRRAPRSPEPAKRWLAFLRNHREAIAAMDFFTVPTLPFSVLYCFFIISHDRRRILHCNVTRHPTSTWIAQQLREAFPYNTVPKFLILDHDAKYGFEVLTTIRSMNITLCEPPLDVLGRMGWRSAGSAAAAASCSTTLSALNERHLKRLLSDYIAYYHDDRTHLGLGKRTPGGRSPALPHGRVIAGARLGGLHHRYDRAA